MTVDSADAAVVSVSGTIHQQEGGDASAPVGVRITRADHQTIKTAPFDLLV
jgi:hypothetical protein